MFMLVVVSLKKGAVERSDSFFQELCKMASVLDENWGFAYSKWAEGLIAEEKGDIGNSLSSLGECIDRWKKVERPYELARAYRDLARVQEKAGMRTEAKESLSAAQRIFAQLKIPR